MTMPYDYEVGPVLSAPDRRARRGPSLRRPLIVVSGIVVFLGLLVAAWMATTGFAYHPFPESVAGSLADALGKPPQTPSGSTPRGSSAQLTADRKKSAAVLAKFIPKGTYVVIDQTHNRVYLKSGEDCHARGGLLGRERGWC